MSHGKRHQHQFRGNALKRKATAMHKDNEKFNAETARLIRQIKKWQQDQGKKP